MQDSERPRFDVADLRKRLGLTPAEMAEKLGVSPQYIYMIEQGKRQPGKFMVKVLESMTAAADAAP